MKNTPAKRFSMSYLPAKAVVPPPVAATLPAIVSVEALGEFLANNHFRAVRCYWTARKEFIVEVEAINAKDQTQREAHSDIATGTVGRADTGKDA
jgi:hypothetical protein